MVPHGVEAVHEYALTFTHINVKRARDRKWLPDSMRSIAECIRACQQQDQCCTHLASCGSGSYVCGTSQCPSTSLNALRLAYLHRRPFSSSKAAQTQWKRFVFASGDAVVGTSCVCFIIAAVKTHLDSRRERIRTFCPKTHQSPF